MIFVVDSVNCCISRTSACLSSAVPCREIGNDDYLVVMNISVVSTDILPMREDAVFISVVLMPMSGF